MPGNQRRPNQAARDAENRKNEPIRNTENQKKTSHQEHPKNSPEMVKHWGDRNPGIGQKLGKN